MESKFTPDFTVEANGKVYEVRRAKKNANLARFQVWESGVNMNGLDATFNFQGYTDDEIGITVPAGWDLTMGGTFNNAAALSAIANHEGLVL